MNKSSIFIIIVGSISIIITFFFMIFKKLMKSSNRVFKDFKKKIIENEKEAIKYEENEFEKVISEIKNDFIESSKKADLIKKNKRSSDELDSKLNNLLSKK